MDVADTFGFLLGAWRVNRSIEDRMAGLTGSFEGSALLVIPPEWQARGVWARYDEPAPCSSAVIAARPAGRSVTCGATTARWRCSSPTAAPTSTSTCAPGPANVTTRAARTC